MLPNEESLPAPAGVIDSGSVSVVSGRLISNASSEQGRFDMMSFSSTAIGQPVPILAYRSWQNAIQNVRRLSSRSVQSRGGGKHCFIASAFPSRRWVPALLCVREYGRSSLGGGGG